MQVEGGYKKPSIRDVLLVQVLFLPYNIYMWSKKWYRRMYVPIEKVTQSPLIASVIFADGLS